ncbi:MAG: nicotinate phosphoribosyltransferase [Thermoplasmata archaeon]|nr:MAG: nicotinate phosphoribosyltransferase [Thermoplasmata archaeon]
MLITSLLDNDLYKFTMQQAVFHQFPNTPVEYEFKCRNTPTLDLLPLKEKIQHSIDYLSHIRITRDEQKYLQSLPFMKQSYLDFLKYFYLDTTKHVTLYEKKGELKINIKGNWLDTILLEVPILAIISEIYSTQKKHTNVIKQLKQKVDIIKDTPIHFADFGTRRRYSHKVQDTVISYLNEFYPQNFIGTSNVYFAMKYNTKPIGTMAHEWIMAGQGLEKHTSLRYSQRYMLDVWQKEYRGNLGIALSDTLGFKAFLNDFDLYFSKLFDGCRHDSGDPYKWCYKLLDHYLKHNIDANTKTAVFSDGLNFQKIRDLYKEFGGRINCSFGIGTNLTNDCGIIPPQIVIKMTKCNNNPVAKISDSLGKQMCEDPNYLKYLASRFRIGISE